MVAGAVKVEWIVLGRPGSSEGEVHFLCALDVSVQYLMQSILSKLVWHSWTRTTVSSLSLKGIACEKLRFRPPAPAVDPAIVLPLDPVSHHSYQLLLRLF